VPIFQSASPLLIGPFLVTKLITHSGYKFFEFYNVLCSFSAQNIIKFNFSIHLKEASHARCDCMDFNIADEPGPGHIYSRHYLAAPKHRRSQIIND
jgi:hypothetical protein